MDIGFLAAAQSSVKLGALRAQWELKKQGKYPFSEEKGDNGLKEMREQLDRLQKDNALNLIEGKLRCGKELTAQELEYLKRERPELYEEALEIKLERRLYRKMLETSRTKKDVQNLHLHKVGMLLSEAEAIKRSGLDGEKKREILDKISKRIAGVQQEYIKYLGSDRYARLPRDERDKKGASPLGRKGAKNKPVYDDGIICLFISQSAYYERALSAVIDKIRMKEGGRLFPPGANLNLTI